MPTLDRPRGHGHPCWYDMGCADVEAAAAFYRAVFGWEYDASGPEYGFYHMARVHGRPAAGLGQTPEGMQAPPPAWTVYFAADDVAVMAARAAELGGRVLMGPMEVPGQGHMAIVADPTGAAFGLWQALGHSGVGVEGEHGTAVWREVDTPDAEAARVFYAGLLGASSRPIEGVGAPYFALVKDGREIGGILQRTEQEGVPPRWTTYFEVDDADAAANAARERGGAVLAEPFDSPYGRVAVLRDPFGATFNVMTSRART